MFNLYQFEKDAQLQEQQLNKTKSHKLLKKARKAERDKLVERYKERVSKFVNRIEKSPVRPPDEYLTRLRKEEDNRKRNKFMGNESMMYSIRSEQERIQKGELLKKSKLRQLPLLA
jgi:hypothetical protein